MSKFVDGQYEAARQAEMAKRFLKHPDKLDRVINVLRTSTWFEHLRDVLQRRFMGGFHGAHSVGKVLEPGIFDKGDKRWDKYAQGLHVPRPETLARVEATVPGSAAFIDERRWKLLNCQRPAHEDEHHLGALAPPVFDCLYVRGSGSQGKFGIRKSLKPSLRSLSDRVCMFDALVASVWLLREAAIEGPSEQCLKIGEVVHRILIMSLSFAPLFAIRSSLLTYFHLHVFPLAGSADVVIATTTGELNEIYRTFNLYLLILEDRENAEIYTPYDSREWGMMFDGTYGLDLMFALAPRYALRQGDQNAQARAFVSSQRVLKEWAVEVTEEGGCEQYPPREVIARAVAARRYAVP